MRLLVIEDNIELSNSMKKGLENMNFKVDISNTGEEGEEKASINEYDVILLDLNLPDTDGIEVLKYLRKKSIDTPIIIITARDNVSDLAIGLDNGADDYITKPFSVRELMARVKANLRKAEVQVQNSANVEKPKKENVVIELGDLILDTERFEVKVRGKIIDLTLREFEVLKYLANQPGQVVTRETLLEKVWGYEYYGDIRTVDVTVRRIREKIEKDTSAPKILITKRGVGYYLATN